MKNNLTKEQLRTRALELYNSNWSVTEICKTLNCSRKWFYKWLNRSQSNDPQWFIERSRRPKTKGKKIDYNTEQLVLETRKKLISTPFMQFGPQAIYYDIKMRNLTPPPVWSIARILQQNQLTDKKRTGAYEPKGKKYPYDGYILSQQMDFVGPRYLSSKTRFYFLNIICCDTHYAQVVVLESQTSNNVCNNLIRFWKTAGIPDFLQMDNDLSFWGSLIRPTALGKIIRLCLLHRVTPVFIPVREPWRNGIIEHFNNTMQGAVLNSGKFKNIGQVQQAAEHFCQIHNQSHHYSCLDGLTPEQYRKKYNYPTVALPEDYTLPNKTLPLEGGEIHIIRFIRSDLKFNVFNLSFVLPEETQYEYVKGVIITHEHRLKIFKEQKYITEFQFRLY